MAAGETNGQRALKELGALVAVAALSGIGGTWGYQQVVPTRPDPFTGAMGHELETRLSQRITALEHEHATIQAWQREWSVSRSDVPQRLGRIEGLLELNAGRLADISGRLKELESRVSGGR